MRIALQCADESRNSIVHIEATLPAIRETIKEPPKVRTRRFVVCNLMMNLEISELLLGSAMYNISEAVQTSKKRI